MPKKVLLLFFWIALHTSLLSQASKVDSLEQILDSNVQDSVRMSVLDQLYTLYYYQDLDKCLHVSQELLKIAERNPTRPFYLCKAYDHLGIVYMSKQMETDTVMTYFEKAANCYEDIDNYSGKVVVLGYMGYFYRKNGQFAKALPLFQEALTIARTKNDTSLLTTTLINMATMFRSRGEHDKALKLLQEARIYIKSTGDQQSLSINSNNIANIYSSQDKLDSALVLYKESLAIKKKLGSRNGIATTLANIGGIYIQQQQYKLAKSYLDEAYSLSEQLNLPNKKGLALHYMASSAVEQQQYQEAIQLAYQGLEAYGPNGQIEFIRELNSTLSQSYEQLHQADSALMYFKRYKALNDSMFHIESEKQIQQLEITYQVKQKEIENHLLKKEQSFIQEKLYNRTYLSIGLIVALLMACGWGVAVYRNDQAKKRMNSILEVQVAERTKDLELTNRQLKQANYELQTFNYIASHDIKEPIRNIGNYVSLIHRRLPETLQTQMQDYFEIIKQSTSQLYTLIEDFASYTTLSKDETVSHKDVDLNMLVSSIEIGLESFISEKHGQIVYKSLPTINSNRSLLFVALKNLIENGIKFNRSSLPLVEITYRETVTDHQIVISDNGIGIDSKYHDQIFIMFKRLHSRAQYLGSGIGLAIVKLIMEKLKGEVKILSKLDSGSTFILRFPKDDFVLP